MLTVCGEFHRISQLVLDKAEKESMTRRKRKNDEPKPQSSSAQYSAKSTKSASSYATTPSTPPANAASPPTSILNQDMTSQLYGEFGTTFSPSNPMSWLNEINPNPAQGFPISPSPSHNPLPPPISSSSFQQPFVPQDLWQMPMTFEWDWADASANMAWNEQSPSGI